MIVLVFLFSYIKLVYLAFYFSLVFKVFLCTRVLVLDVCSVHVRYPSLTMQLILGLVTEQSNMNDTVVLLLTKHQTIIIEISAKFKE